MTSGKANKDVQKHYLLIDYYISNVNDDSCLRLYLSKQFKSAVILQYHYQNGYMGIHLVRLETFICDSFIEKEHVVTVFFDLEQADCVTWRYRILKYIHKLGLKGRLPLFIENFLADCTLQVRVGSSLSDEYDQEQGVTQGGVLSITLF